MSDQYTSRLSEYVDDELTPADRLEVDQHLLDCVACQAALDGLRRVVAGARALEDEPPARDLWPSVRAALPVRAPVRRINL